MSNKAILGFLVGFVMHAVWREYAKRYAVKKEDEKKTTFKKKNKK